MEEVLKAQDDLIKLAKLGEFETRALKAIVSAAFHAGIVHEVEERMKKT